MPIKLVKENDNLTLLKNIMKGDPGDSAYQIALENGFEGTEEEWLASLQGEDGAPGVYVGAEEPTDADTLVWVDPDEETDVVITEEQVLELIAENGGGASAAFLDFYSLTSTQRVATEEEAAVFESIYLGEHPIVYICSRSTKEYYPVGYILDWSMISFYSSRIACFGTGLYTGDHTIKADAACYRALRQRDGSWKVWQATGCRDVAMATQAELDALEEYVVNLEISGGGGEGSANVYEFDWSDLTTTDRESTTEENIALSKVRAKEPVALNIIKDSVKMPVEIKYLNDLALEIKCHSIAQNTDGSLTLSSIVYGAWYDGYSKMCWYIKIKQQSTETVLASQDWIAGKGYQTEAQVKALINAALMEALSTH